MCRSFPSFLLLGGGVRGNLMGTTRFDQNTPNLVAEIAGRPFLLYSALLSTWPPIQLCRFDYIHGSSPIVSHRRPSTIDLKPPTPSRFPFLCLDPPFFPTRFHHTKTRTDARNPMQSWTYRFNESLVVSSVSPGVGVVGGSSDSMSS